ncbi:MAG: zinc ABC transporter substrate-binding protein [Anaerolineales bacterium]|nr:zinc ABC transporter substrate-binding protein [Anaerolineales bacterium]
MKKNAVLLIAFMLALSACGGGATGTGPDRLQVLATTGIVADVVAQVGGTHVGVIPLLPPGSDPHTFEPRPRDAAALADAELVFASGAGLEEFLEPLLESAGAVDKLVEVSAGIELLPFAGANADEHAQGDPHTWLDPNNVLVWVENIYAALAAADPGHAAVFRTNADAYAAELLQLDDWIRNEVAQVPPERRLLVSDHAVFGYFAAAYGFEQVGTLTASFSTNAAPSARELAALEDDIRLYDVPAVFVGVTVNQELAAQVARDTGVQLVMVYHGSLSPADGPAATYLDLMRYNVTAIVNALR